MSKLVELRDVTKIYEIGDEIRVKALQGASLTVDKREMVSIMGPSGCGKSTLLNMIGGLDNPTSGQVIIDGVDITDMNEGELASFRGERIGFIFQSYNLVPTLTALENVELPMIFAEKYASKEISERAADMLGLVGLGERLHHRPNQLSGGQQQRVAIARALANEPSIIIADEPTGNIDRETGLKIIRFFQHLNKTLGQTFILVTHDPDIARVSQRILHMLDGKITSRPAKTSIKPSKQILLEEQRQLMLAELKWLENSLTRLEESKANLTP
ncbi:ABC transporter ATP-binding protein, partial [Candidatus Bathyarchaeota archaeon]|nr:ABC transporter ATP-binding protein [Candidatus Bathyarchaeota archaeon]